MVRIRKTDYKKSNVSYNKYRRSFLYNVVLDKLQEHLEKIEIVLKGHPNIRIPLSGDSLREFVWCIRSKESEDNIDVWVSTLGKHVEKEMEKIQEEGADI